MNLKKINFKLDKNNKAIWVALTLVAVIGIGILILQGYEPEYKPLKPDLDFSDDLLSIIESELGVKSTGAQGESVVSMGSEIEGVVGALSDVDRDLSGG
ncbi:MAG: hypothetical protein J4224_03840 [Candidatus Diapherotrites archaeon]|uniref:Uncharacterized protein n=1 Tax=Candidatus Iainarchaeum sp. TaxID=3101447 RepID=A0A7J4IWM0_9ARCH|nr:MAG: hypothetical protein QT03_C0001G0792 [archaeon GW2011_AR10]MBS3059525.1 hypothetical protein [Candidatus Diapherotrites archaeon]HIH08679.1 hypothetical protein [Candidatus Diapherotrites archaeon]